MFYSHEILTSRKYGVATVWLVATLGPKSVTKRVNRKAILEVDVRKACETIIQPEAPMALRLQSNLLYGVSRVYNQQCGYVLQDVQSAQNTMKALLKVIKNSELDLDAGKARPEHLILLDDPAFLPDLAIPALDFDLTNLDISLEESQRSLVPSVLSQHSQISRHRSGSSVSQASIAGLIIPSSDAGSQQLPPLNDPFMLAGSSAQKPSSAAGGRISENFDEDAFFDDLGFEFDADGGLIDDPAEIERRRTGSSASRPIVPLGSDSAASARVRQEHEEALARLGQGQIAGQGEGDNYDIIMADDDYNILPDAEPFPAMASSPLARRGQRQDESSPVITESSSSTVEAPIRRRKPRASKVLTIDRKIELTNTDLMNWKQDYLKNMEVANRVKKVNRAPTVAKKTADFMVWGSGIGNIGALIRDSGGLDHPLAMFAGNNLKALLTGEELTPSAPVTPMTRSSQKRSLEPEGNEEGNRRVRARLEGQEEAEQLGRAFDDEPLLPALEDSTGLEEVARGEAQALDDYPPSAMPWNVSSSIKSFRTIGGPRSSSIIPGSLPFAGLPIGPSSNIAAASPSLGRGIGHRVARASDLGSAGDQRRDGDGHDDEGRPVDDQEDPNIDFGRLLVHHEEDLNSDEERGREKREQRLRLALERAVHGPLAEVDTQTAQNSQWVREAMARESINFWEFVRNSIQERTHMVDHGDEDVDMEMAESSAAAAARELKKKSVLFEELIPPQEQSPVVAAQAFHHILTLVTRNTLKVEQLEGYGDIRLWISEDLEDLEDKSEAGEGRGIEV